MSDLERFHKMQSNPKVMQYVTGMTKSYDEHKAELERLIKKYAQLNNDFRIYAIERIVDGEFIGTCALVKDEEGDDEIGYRFIEDYWGNGYGYEVCKGLISYCKTQDFMSLTAYVVDVNVASAKILEKCNFNPVSKGLEPSLKLPETKYKLNL